MQGLGAWTDISVSFRRSVEPSIAPLREFWVYRGRHESFGGASVKEFSPSASHCSEDHFL